MCDEGLDALACHGDTTALELLSLFVDKAGFNELLVNVESYIAWHSRFSPPHFDSCC